MRSFSLRDESDIKKMRELIQRLPSKPTIPDFEEFMLLESVRAVTRLWWQHMTLHGFAFVDEFNNLWFETDQVYQTEYLERRIVDWGVQVQHKRNAATGRMDTLDSTCSSADKRRIEMLEKYGFVHQDVRTLRYARSLDEPILEQPLPAGFSIRSVNGEKEVEELVALHRAAFGTDKMTVEQRLAIMHTPQYDPELDLVAVAPDGELAAFCICGIVPRNAATGFTDPIGVRPNYQKKGLGRALVTAGMQALQRRGISRVQLGTSSKNVGMQRLAEVLGFKVVSEGLWYSKTIP